jgi:hypothetical protein
MLLLELVSSVACASLLLLFKAHSAVHYDVTHARKLNVAALFLCACCRLKAWCLDWG